MDSISPVFVLLLGMGSVFVGLVALILLMKLLSRLFGPTAETAGAAAAAPGGEIPDRKAFDAAVAAAIASYMDMPPAGIRILSVRKV